MSLVSGPSTPDKPYRYGCACMATWNSDEPLDLKRLQYGLCGPYCNPKLFLISGPDGDEVSNPEVGDEV
jgi:hypothetical protein